MMKRNSSYIPNHPQHQWQENLEFRDKFPNHQRAFLTEIVSTKGELEGIPRKKNPDQVDSQAESERFPPERRPKGIEASRTQNAQDQDQLEFLGDLDPSVPNQRSAESLLRASEGSANKRSKKYKTSMRLGLQGISQDDQDQDQRPRQRKGAEVRKIPGEKIESEEDQAQKDLEDLEDPELETLVNHFRMQARVQARRIRSQAKAVALQSEIQAGMPENQNLANMKATLQTLKSKHSSLINRVVRLEQATGKRLQEDSIKREMRFQKRMKLMSPETIFEEFLEQIGNPNLIEKSEESKMLQSYEGTLSNSSKKILDRRVLQAPIPDQTMMEIDRATATQELHPKAAEILIDQDQQTPAPKTKPLMFYDKEAWKEELRQLEIAVQQKKDKKANEKARKQYLKRLFGPALWIFLAILETILSCLNWFLQPLVLLVALLNNLVNSQAPKSYAQISAQGNQMEKMERMLVGLNTKLETHIELLSFHQNSLTISGWAIAVVSLVIILALTICQFRQWKMTRSTGQPDTPSPANLTGNMPSSHWTHGNQGTMGNPNQHLNQPPYFAHSTGASLTAPINSSDPMTPLYNQPMNLNPTLGTAAFGRPIFANQNRGPRFTDNRFEDLDEEFQAPQRRVHRQRARAQPINHLNNNQVDRAVEGPQEDQNQ